jgi:hypothetical protein
MRLLPNFFSQEGRTVGQANGGTLGAYRRIRNERGGLVDVVNYAATFRLHKMNTRL